MLLHKLLSTMMRRGRLAVVYAGGRVENYGDGSGPPVAVRLTKAGERRIALNPSLGLGEAYMDGDLSFDQGDFFELMAIAGRNLTFRPEPPRSSLVRRVLIALVRHMQEVNGRVAARENVHHHYDLSYELYSRFLDADMQYSCAYFAWPEMSLEEAQIAKKAHIAAKLALKPGMRVLDIGCGWGGLALTLAKDYGVQVCGVTLSTEQLAVAERRAAEAGLSERVHFSLTDYRDLKGPFDRIVSVGMFEHVGAPNYRAFFGQVRDLLTEDGVALIHSIARADPPAVTAPFIRKYIFPGGSIPALSEVTTAVEDTGLWPTDIELLRLHYAETLHCWRDRFVADRAAIAAMYDERFCRMWETYLAMSEISFRAGSHMVMQLQLAKRVDALPITRDYMYERERAALAAKIEEHARA
ncbi:MAG: class I SAM-dependent methyltransferase [Caulobacteraceae bacterium]|nr:class I SAM-dependent methyltransferase [Caulobacteraceae bacterium]